VVPRDCNHVPFNLKGTFFIAIKKRKERKR
jgi:hypothetical protein